MNGEPLPLTCPGDSDRPKKKSCNSGCALRAPIRPRFSTGQQLYAEDLGDLSGWVDDRLRLQRYRGGWGAVCGLGVSVRNRDADAYPTLIVHSGYAVSPCGTDIVVPKPLPVCLKEKCQAFLDPCGRADRDEEKLDILGQKIPKKELLWLDLYLSPKRKPTQYRPVSARSGAPHGGYEPSREKDTGHAEVEVVKAADHPPPGSHHTDEEDAFASARDAFLNELEKGKELKGPDLKNWVIEWMAREVKELPWAGGVSLRRELIEQLGGVFDEPPVTADTEERWKQIKDQRVKLFAFLYLGWLSHAPFTCPCATVDRVRLARVIVWVRKPVPHCPAVIADPHPPYRRLYGPTDTPPGAIALRPYYGAWYETVNDFPPLTDQLTGVTKEPLNPTDPAALIKDLREPSLASAYPKWSVAAHVLSMPLLGDRILRFTKAGGSA